jgi:hypothetical protein
LPEGTFLKLKRFKFSGVIDKREVNYRVEPDGGEIGGRQVFGEIPRLPPPIPPLPDNDLFCGMVQKKRFHLYN